MVTHADFDTLKLIERHIRPGSIDHLGILIVGERFPFPLAVFDTHLAIILHLRNSPDKATALSCRIDRRIERYKWNIFGNIHARRYRLHLHAADLDLVGHLQRSLVVVAHVHFDPF